MIQFEFPFNPEEDSAPVEQSGFLSLQEAWVNRAVPGDVSGSSVDYNGIEEPESIAGKPRDFADAYMLSKKISEAQAHYDAAEPSE